MTYKVITGTLKARTAIHVGSGRGNDLTDALIRRDAAGNPIIPGTAIAGALRTLATRLAPRLGAEPCAALTGSSESCTCAVCHLFGDINPSDAEGAESAASRILVFNARLKNDAPHPLIRDGVGIDRVTGAAAVRVKFDLEVLPAGTKFEVRFELRDTSDDDERLLAALLAEWQAGRAWLGGRVARGLGAFRLESIEYKILDLDNADNLLAFLEADEPWCVAKPQPGWLSSRLSTVQSSPVDANAPPAVLRCWVTIEGVLQAQGPLLTNDTTVAGKSGFDHAPLLVQMGSWGNPVLAGSGLRGVLRSHAERIARTLATWNAWNADRDDPTERERHFLTHCPACSPVESRKDAPLASCDTLLKGTISSTEIVSDEHLCLACRLFGSTRRGSRLIVEDAPFDRNAAGGDPKLKMFDFLAIDRFTGGGKDGAKFDALALWRPAFKLRLHLENPADWELGWLALVLRDLADGWLSVGFGAAKGFGRVKLQNLTATFGYLSPEDLPHDSLEPQSPGTSGIFKTVQVQGDGWKTVAQAWVDRFHEEVNGFSRQDLPPLQKDSYFGKVDELYPVIDGGAQ